MLLPIWRPASSSAHMDNQKSQFPPGRLGQGLQAHAASRQHWRRVNFPHLVALIHAGVMLPDSWTSILCDIPEQAGQAVFKVQEDATELTSIHCI